MTDKEKTAAENAGAVAGAGLGFLGTTGFFVMLIALICNPALLWIPVVLFLIWLFK